MDGRVMEKAPAETRGFTDLRIQNFRRTLDQLQDRASSVLLLTLQWKEIEEQFDLSRNEIEVREKEVNAMKESVNGQILELDKREERLSKVEARQKELDSVIEEKLKDLEEKEKEFGLKQDEIERKKVEFDLKIKRKDEEFELKEKKLEERSKEFELKDKKLEERSKEFELKKKKLEEQAKEFVLGKKKLDERAKELELKERELEERSKKLSSPRENSRPEVEPSISLLTKHVGFSASMDYENQTRDDDDDLMSNRASLALQILSLDPAKRVLDAVQGVYQPHLKMSDGKADKSVSIKSCIVLLEKLMKMNPKIEPEVKGEAIKLSIDWFNEVATNPENEMEVLVCFLFLAVYCLASAFTPHLLFNLLEHTTLYDQSPKLFQLLGFKDKASGVVETPIEKEEYFAAIKFICEFRISAKFRPSCLLQRYLNSSEKAARRIVGTGNSPEVQRTFREIQKADAVVALKYIKEKKCEKIFPIKILESSIDALEKQLASQNTTVPTQGCKKRSQAHQSNDKHHSLSEGTGLSATGASISSEEPDRANKHQRTTEPTGVKIKESTENHHLKTTVPSASSSPSTEPKPSVPFDNINRDVSGVPVEKHCTEEETALSNALRCSPDPAKLVLDTVMVLHPSNLEGDFEFKLRVSPNKCFLFLDQLKKLSPQIEDQVKDEAKKLAILWKFKFSENNKSDHLEIVCFLLFLGIFKVVSEFKADELLHLLDNAQSLSPDLCHFLGLANKMVCGDFVGAQKLVVKAQRLFPDLESLTQLVAIYDVHCSAQKKISGLDNWYGILQVELFADEAIIKKQYRKLALLLHPDKNKFAGAEAAFKLIGEAHRLLADRITRSQYDVKCRAFSRGLAVRAGKNQPNMNPGSQSAAANYVVNSAGNQKTSHLAFWTCCQFCKYRYKYLREYVSQLMFCYNCQKYYVAVDVGPDAAPTGPTSGQFSSPKEIPAQGPCSASAQNDNGKATGVRPLGKSMSSAQTRRSGSAAAAEIGKNAMMEEKLNKKYKGSQRNNAGVDKAEKDVGGQKNNAGVPKPEKDLGGQNNNDKAPPKPQSTVKEPEIGAAKPAADTIAPEFDVPKTDEKATSKGKDTKKKRKDVEEIDQENTGAEPDSNGSTKRRSSRKKPQVTYAEDGSDDDFVSPPSKKSKSHKAYDSSADAHKETARENTNSTFGVMSGKCEADGEEVVPSSDVDEVDYVCEANENPDLLNCPDPEFNSFEKTSDCFAVHQVWAIYDPIDGMPRFYAQIKKVLASPLLVKMTWLEFTQGMENETNETIPTACGKFENGETENVDDHLVFSHQMHYVRCGKRYVYIYPKKGEIWALFRDWDVSWTNNTQKHRPPYKYDFVEVLCDYSDVQGIRVGYLRKLKGFVSLFNRVEQQGVVTLNIPPGEMHRFSHKVPSFKMSGNEKGVPAGSFELDPAALPSDIFDLDHKDTDGVKLNAKPEGGCPNSRNVEAKNKVRPEQVHTPKKRHKTDGDDASSPMLGTSAENASNGIWNNQDQVHTSRSSGPEDALNRQKFEKGGHPVDALKLRKSPRALSEKNSQMNSGQQKIEDTSKQKNSEGNELSGQSDGDGLSANKMNTPRKLEKDIVNEALRLRRSPRSTNKTDGQLQTDHGIAENVGRHSNLKNHETNEKRLTQSSGSNVVKKSSNSDANLSSSCRSRQESSVCFEEKNSDDRFQVDQIWALYNNTNGMPTDYVQIKGIETTPKFRLHAVFLEPCLLPKNSARPICCGVFKLKPEKAKVLPQSSFSHQLNAVKVDKSRFEVYPRKGEIWALQRTACSDTSGGHDIVEVTEENSQVIKVAVLTVNRLKSQYRAWKSHGSTAACITTIQRSEVARFSHQIPVIRNQPRKDRLGGFWELDPSAIPSLTITLD